MTTIGLPHREQKRGGSILRSAMESKGGITYAEMVARG
jgi:hypothetical protein